MQDWSDKVSEGETEAIVAMLQALEDDMAKTSTAATLSMDLSEVSTLLEADSIAPIVIHNPMDFSLSEFIVSVDVPCLVQVLDADLNVVSSEMNKDYSKVYWAASIPAFGYNTYFLRKTIRSTLSTSGRASVDTERAEVFIENDYYAIEFSLLTNQLTAITAMEPENAVCVLFIWF